MTLPAAGYFTDPARTNGEAKQAQDDMLGTLLAFPATVGDVTGPASSTTGNLPAFSDTTGKDIEDSGVAVSDVLLSSNNLSDLASASTARTNLGLGTAATKSTGVLAGNVVEVQVGGKLPALDASALTNLPGGGGGLPGDISRLAIAVTGNTALTLTADAAVLSDGTTQKLFRTISLTLSTSSVGANALDAGTVANSTWYAVWIIGKTDGTIAGLLSTNATTPVLPSGYTFKGRAGWVRTNTSANLLGIKQFGRRAQYTLGGANLSTLPLMVSGAVGSNGSAWSTVSVATFVPPTAICIAIAGTDTNSNSGWAVAPNSSYTPAANTATSNAPPYQYYRTLLGATSGEIMLEGTSICVVSIAGCQLACLGWEDNL